MGVVLVKRWVCSVILAAFMLTSVVPSSYAQAALSLPLPGQMVALSPAFNPPVLKGIKVYPDNPLRFDFILDKGDDKSTDEQIKTDSTRLIKYFLASLTIPEKDLWVNLSPYEKDRIVPEAFGQTEMGRDLLAQDYLLKQITSSLLYPEGDTGKKFWQKVYALAQEKYGTTDIPVDTFNKVWIVPEKAVVYENGKVGAAYVTESRMKVMLESDYLAEEMARRGSIYRAPCNGSDCLEDRITPGAMNGAPTSEATSVSDIAKSVLREIVIPVLEQEVNEGKNFAQLRQVYQSLILAAWYKKKIKQSLLSAVYVDRKKTDGVNISDPKEAEKIWGQYVEAFKRGVSTSIKEEIDQKTQVIVARKYFSGGWSVVGLGRAMSETADQSMLNGVVDKLKLAVIRVGLGTLKASEILDKSSEIFEGAGGHVLFGGYDNNVVIYGPSLLPRQYIYDVQHILSLCRKEDLQGLRMSLVPFWHPRAVLTLMMGARGFQSSRGITVVFPYNRRKFIEIFTHELTHWLLRNKLDVLSKLDHDIFDAEERVKVNVTLPSWYSGVNPDEYAAELTAYAITHRDDRVISSEKRAIIAREIFNIEPDKLYVSSFPGVAIDHGSSFYLAAMAHAWLLLGGSAYAEYFGLYFNISVVTMLAALSWRAYKPIFVNKSTMKIMHKLSDSYRKIMILNVAILVAISLSSPMIFMSVGLIDWFKQSNESAALSFVKARPDLMEILLDIPPQGSVHKDEQLMDWADKRFRGEVPYIDDIPDHEGGLLNGIAMIERYYGIIRSPEDVARSWSGLNKIVEGDLDTYRRVPGGILLGSRLRPGGLPPPMIECDHVYKRVTVLPDGMIVDGLAARMLSTEEQIRSAIRNGHPVLEYSSNRLLTEDMIKNNRIGEDVGIVVGFAPDRLHNPPKLSVLYSDRIGEETFFESPRDPIGDKTYIEIYPVRTESVSDRSMIINDKGGMDFVSSDLKLDVQHSGQEIKLHFDPAQLQQMHDATGFSPVIIGIQPINSLNDFLGLADRLAVGIKPG